MKLLYVAALLLFTLFLLGFAGMKCRKTKKSGDVFNIVGV